MVWSAKFGSGTSAVKPTSVSYTSSTWTKPRWPSFVFDGQKENIFETLGQWDRDLTRRLLGAPLHKDSCWPGRVDAGGMRVSRTEIERFAAKNEASMADSFETSAKTGQGCEELRTPS